MKRLRATRRVSVLAAGIAGSARSLRHAVGLGLAGGAAQVRAWVTVALRNGGGGRALAPAVDGEAPPNYATQQREVARDPWVDEIIDGRNEIVKVEGYQYEPSETLYNNDPIAYRDKVLELQDTRPDPAA